MPGWNRECPLGVPLTVYILTLAGPDSFLRALVSIGRGGFDLRDFGVFFLIIFYFAHHKVCICAAYEIGNLPWVFMISSG